MTDKSYLSAIDREGGLEPYLERRRSLHDGKGYPELLVYFKEGRPLASIARLFSADGHPPVSRHTIRNWKKKLMLDGTLKI